MIKSFFLSVWGLLKVAILAAVIVLPIRYFIFQPFVVRGISMEPTFYDGDYLIVNEISYHFTNPQRGEIIIFHYPKNPSERFIKRVIGLPGEEVIINGDKITIKNKSGSHILDESSYLGNSRNIFEGRSDTKLSDNQYFVIGDNRLHSFDSRMWGPVNRKFLIGKVFLRVLPFSRFHLFKKPNYNF